jgi:predicted phosphodiesterase
MGDRSERVTAETSATVKALLPGWRNDAIANPDTDGGVLMRIGIFADVHGNLPALKAVLADGGRRKVDKWLSLGDIAFRGPAPGDCLALARTVAEETAVAGNTEYILPSGPHLEPGDTPGRLAAMRIWWQWTVDRIAPGDLKWASTLPVGRTIEHEGVSLLYCHASARHVEERVDPRMPEADMAAALMATSHSLVACAHIHQPYLRRCGKCTAFNVGSAGRPTDGDPRASYAIVEIDQGNTAVELRRIVYDIEETARLSRESGFPGTNEYIAALRIGGNF